MKMASEIDQLEAVSLMSNVERDGDAGEGGKANINKHPTRRTHATNKVQITWRSRIKVVILLVLPLFAAVTIFNEYAIAFVRILPDDQVVPIPDDQGTAAGDLDMEELVKNLLEAKQNFYEIQTADYGEYADQIFDTVSVMGYFKSPTTLSQERLKRSLQMKILESLVLEHPKSEKKKEVTFTWVIGGHSASAGHGNLFKQASPNVIEESLQPIFRSIGIQFYAKNYGMGGTSSGPEVALCMESIFGPNNIDILSWDYALSEKLNKELYNLWMQRAQLHSSRPILFSFGQRYADECHVELEENGGAGFECAKNFNNLRNIFPDSDDPDLNSTNFPRAIKDYMCKGHPETKKPCGDKAVKFNTSQVCPDGVKGKVSWHNGWKDHLLIGRIAAAFIIENLLEAIDDMLGVNVNVDIDIDGDDSSSASGMKTKTSTSASQQPESDDDEASNSNSDSNNSKVVKVQPSISVSYLRYLYALKEEETSQFFDSEPNRHIYTKGYGIQVANFTHFQRSRGWCRTALLPSQARYDGVVTDSLNKFNVTYLHAGRTDYKDEGYDINKLPESEPDNDETPIHLVYNIENSRSICEHAEIDFKDAFFVRVTDKWMTTTIPNDSELSYFETIDDPHGFITICTRFIRPGIYPKDYVKIPEMVGIEEIDQPVKGDWGIKVNGVKVTNATVISKDYGRDRCYVLKHDGDDNDGYYFPNVDGRYKLQFRVPRAGNLYISSIVVM